MATWTREAVGDFRDENVTTVRVAPQQARLRARPETGRRRRIPTWLTGIGLVVLAAFVATVVKLAVQRWFMLDLRIYRWGGLLARHSGDLYGLHYSHFNLGFTYPPIAALIFAAMSAVSLATLKFLITIGGVLSLIATSWLTWGALGYRRSVGRLGAALAAASVILWFQPVVQTLYFGQVNLIMMMIIVADLRLPDSFRLKGAGVGLAAGFKLTPLIFIAYLLLTRRFRAASVAAETFALTIAVSFILLPGQSRSFWFGGLFLDPHRTGNNAYVGNQSLHGALVRLLGSTALAQDSWIGASVIVGIAGLLLAAWAARHGREMAGILLCALTGLLISPISWTHHWVWVAPAAIVVASLTVRRETRLRLAAGRLPDWRQWARWAGLVAAAVPFFTLPQGLVAAAVVQGTGAHGTQLLTENLYVLIGLAVLGIAGFSVLRARRLVA
ncbi:MAG: glycosyltransferase 87 family protein [Streptosporangiaceae bacterium]